MTIFPGATAIVMGFGNAVGNIAGIVAPSVTGAALERGGCPRDAPTNTSGAAPPPITAACREAWASVWAVSAATLALSGLLFVVFGSMAPGRDRRSSNGVLRGGGGE